MAKTAIISGITGQDGSYLAKLLVEKKYKVIGLVRSNSQSRLKKLEYLGIDKKVIIEECDLQDITQVMNLLSKYKPKEFYNLAAQSSVALSFQQPIGTLSFNITSVLNIVEAIKIVDKKIRLYQASSSEMYGKVKNLPITESSTLHPMSPYAVSKASCHWAAVNYRESYGLYIACGILFNHESFLRSNNFIIKKLIRQAIRIKEGKQEEIVLGNLNIKRDFGYSPKYVEAMWLMLQQDKADDFVICSGKSVSLKSIVKHVFKRLKLPLSKIKTDKKFFRPNEIKNIYGDPSKAARKLKWKYEMSFYDVLDLLIDEELESPDISF